MGLVLEKPVKSAGWAISPLLIDQIKNIRFTNQSPRCNIFGTGGIGWGFRVVAVGGQSDFGASNREWNGD